jgi:hypothetical protein
VSDSEVIVIGGGALGAVGVRPALVERELVEAAS